jgi:hypothetical protein
MISHGLSLTIQSPDDGRVLHDGYRSVGESAFRLCAGGALVATMRVTNPLSVTAQLPREIFVSSVDTHSQIVYLGLVMDQKTYHKQWRQAHRDRWLLYSANWYEKNREAILLRRSDPERRAKANAYAKQYRLDHPEKIRLLMHSWQERNQDRMKAYRRANGPRRRELYHINREKVLAQKRERAPRYRLRVQSYQRKRRATDIQACLACRLRATMGRALRRNFVKKSKRTFELIGCTPTELKAHLESKFLPGMTWENRRSWHVDHIRPISSFDLTKLEEQAVCFHYTNLQPLWALDNHRKSDTV